MKIGNIEIQNGLFLGPMAGFTDLPFRKIAKELGVGLTYTEMVSAKALYYGDKKTQRLLEAEDELCAVQIFGREPEIMKYAARLLEDRGVPMIDINMGCPVPKIVNNGEGSALLREKELAAEIVSSIKSAVKIPVTAKIRRGWDDMPDVAVDVAKLLDEAGVDAICVHGRTREQYYLRKSDRGIIKRVKDAVRCPVIGNGDVCSWEDYRSMLEETGCDGVMIARGACQKPWIFKECIDGRTYDIPLEERVRLMLRHYELSVEFYGEWLAIPQMRKQFHCYVKGLPGAAKLKDEINRLETLEQVKALLGAMVENH
ncbi:MAG: tRNA dihydrouridine synthase DusB [Clostridia bacterium]|nr:tRNA dihydrouridine synthase DusB [Clostridia bacterium]